MGLQLCFVKNLTLIILVLQVKVNQKMLVYTKWLINLCCICKLCMLTQLSTYLATKSGYIPWFPGLCSAFNKQVHAELHALIDAWYHSNVSNVNLSVVYMLFFRVYIYKKHNKYTFNLVKKRRLTTLHHFVRWTAEYSMSYNPIIYKIVQ